MRKQASSRFSSISMGSGFGNSIYLDTLFFDFNTLDLGFDHTTPKTTNSNNILTLMRTAIDSIVL